MFFLKKFKKHLTFKFQCNILLSKGTISIINLHCSKTKKTLKGA